MAPGFRFKLVLAMMIVVGLVSAATFLVTQKQVETAYEKLFEDSIQTQIMYLPKEQENRLSTVKERCRELAESVRLQAMLREGGVEEIYVLARDELKKALPQNLPEGAEKLTEPDVKAPPGIATNLVAAPAPTTNSPPAGTTNSAAPARSTNASSAAPRPAPPRKGGARPAPAVNRPLAATFFGFLDAEGKLLKPEKTRWNITSFVTHQRFVDQMDRIGAAIGKLSSQQVGYLEVSSEKKENRFLEIVVTPVFDSQTRDLLGALILGFPYRDKGEETISQVSDIENGIFFDGHLYSRTIPANVQTNLAAQLTAEIAGHPVPRADFVIPIEGVPHRVFYTPLNPDSLLPIAYKVGLYSWGTALKAQADLRSKIIFYSSAAFGVALVISLILAHGLAVPLRALVRGTREIQRGNYAHKVEVRSRDELGELASSFNEMTEGLALKEKYRNVLNLVVDSDVASELMNGKVVLGGEMREATILFCDIRGFTALTQNMNPADIIHFLNEHMTELTRIVYAHNGVVDKFVGDSLMAVFGAPKSYGNDALNAVRCAIEMIEARKKLNETSRYKIEIGVGVSTGPVLAGNMGSADRMNYTVLGERVNLAARLCNSAARGEILIGEFTREKLGDLVTVERGQQLLLKGFAHPVQAYRLLAVQPAQSTAPGTT
jgi:class 3 adenylate cyclase